MAARTDYHGDKHVFRHTLLPDDNEGLNVGSSGQRFNKVYAREVIADIGSFGVAIHSIGAGQIPYGNSGGSALTSEAALSYDETNNILSADSFAGYMNPTGAAFASLASSGSGVIGRVTDGIRGLVIRLNNQWLWLNGRVVDVTWFGAVGDGTTDDTTAIANAIAACASGGAVWFPPGLTFQITSTISLTAPIKLFSTTRNGAILRWDGNDGTMFNRVEETTNTRFQGLEVQDIQFKLSDENDACKYFVINGGNNDCRFINCRFTGSDVGGGGTGGQHMAVEFNPGSTNGAFYHLFDHCHFRNLYKGLNFLTGTVAITEVKVRGCAFGGTKFPYWGGGSGGSARITESSFEGQNTGMFVAIYSDKTNFSIRNCRFEMDGSSWSTEAQCLAPSAAAAAVNLGTDTITSTAHGLIDNDLVTVETTGTLPGGVTQGIIYYVNQVDADNFQLSLSSGPGSAVDLHTSQGSGTHTFRKVNVNKPGLFGVNSTHVQGAGNTYVPFDAPNLILDGIRSHDINAQSGYGNWDWKPRKFNTVGWILTANTSQTSNLFNLRDEGSNANISFGPKGQLIHNSAAVDQFSANTDNWQPQISSSNTNLTFLRLSATTPVNLTGMVAGKDGEVRILANRSANAITLVHNATSTAANRFRMRSAANYVLAANDGVVWCVYDENDARWRVDA